jgi:small subunit ribosomal protein S6
VRTYDTTFIVNPQTDDTTIDKHVQAVANVITKNGGKILKEDRMGTRRLAYPIQHLTQGYYTSFIYEGKEEIPQLLDRHFRMGEAYVRDMTIVFEGDINAPARREFPGRDGIDHFGGPDRRESGGRPFREGRPYGQGGGPRRPSSGPDQHFREPAPKVREEKVAENESDDTDTL